MSEKIYVQGFRTFAKSENAPAFVLGTLIIDVADFKEFVNNNQHLLTEYNGKKQLKINMTKSDKGQVIFKIDTYQKEQ
jgi:hypothetical protein